MTQHPDGQGGASDSMQESNHQTLGTADIQCRLNGRGSAHGRCRSGAQTRRKTNVPLVPPKPKLFFTATSIFISRAVLAQ